MLIWLLEARWPLIDKLGHDLARALNFLLFEILAHNADALLVVDEGPLRFNLLKEASDFEIGVVVLWI